MIVVPMVLSATSSFNLGAELGHFLLRLSGGVRAPVTDLYRR